MHDQNCWLHSMTPIPEGKAVGDLLPVFSDVSRELYIGKPTAECASCRKPFGAVRKRRKAVRMYPVSTLVPVAFSFDICGRCYALYQQAGPARDAVLAAVESYCEGNEAKQ